jgi:hypothetical protein
VQKSVYAVFGLGGINRKLASKKRKIISYKTINFSSSSDFSCMNDYFCMFVNPDESKSA